MTATSDSKSKMMTLTITTLVAREKSLGRTWDLKVAADLDLYLVSGEMLCRSGAARKDASQ